MIPFVLLLLFSLSYHGDTMYMCVSIYFPVFLSVRRPQISCDTYLFLRFFWLVFSFILLRFPNKDTSIYLDRSIVLSIWSLLIETGQVLLRWVVSYEIKENCCCRRVCPWIEWFNHVVCHLWLLWPIDPIPKTKIFGHGSFLLSWSKSFHLLRVLGHHRWRPVTLLIPKARSHLDEMMVRTTCWLGKSFRITVLRIVL